MPVQLKPHRVAVLAAAMSIVGMAWSASESDLPPVQTQGDVTYLSGGIGGDQQSAMKQAASGYPLELQFIETRDAQSVYAAGVRVSIRDQMGKVLLEARSNGPFLFAKLPQGQYTITADNSGRIETRQAMLETGKHKSVIFQWRG